MNYFYNYIKKKNHKVKKIVYKTEKKYIYLMKNIKVKKIQKNLVNENN